MDVTSLHEALLTDLLKRVQASGQKGTQLIDLMCEREGLIRVGDQFLLSTVAARIEYDKGSISYAVEILDNLFEEAHALKIERENSMRDQMEKRNKRIERMQTRINPSLPPRNIVKPGYRRIMKQASGGFGLIDTVLTDAFKEQNYRMVTQMSEMVARLYQSPFITALPKVVNDALESQQRFESYMLKNVSGLKTFGLVQSDYTPALYEDVPEMVEEHPLWVALNRVDKLVQQSSVMIWQRSQSERRYRNPSEDIIDPHSPRSWLDRQRKAYDRALEALVKNDSIRFEGTRKQKRYFSIEI